MTRRASILLVDDHPVFRAGLHRLLDKQKGLKVVGEARDGESAIEMVKEHEPDIVVMDISMPGLNGIEATRRILSEFPDTKIMALSVHSGKSMVGEMLGAGAAGYILKESVPEEMVEGIRTVLAGDVYLSKVVSDVVVSDYRRLISEAGPASEGDSEPILMTKLHPPPISSDIIPRPRLLALLEGGRNKPMTLVSAAAGYGKSILVGQWLEACDCPSAWVSLDEDDNDFRVFLTYVLASIRKLFPETRLKTRTLLQAVDLPPTRMIVRSLLNDLDRVGGSLILVLDDYHRIKEPVIHDFLADLLRHPSPTLHLVILTRHDPPLPISSMRAQNQLTEIAVEHLRFTPEETGAFLVRFLHVQIDDEMVGILWKKMEGWVTGLRLAAISLGPEGDRARILQILEEDFRYVQEYLMEEVLSRVPPAFARYLTATSVLDRFSADLCEAVVSGAGDRKGREDELNGRAFMDWLDEAHLFVTPLDEQRHWFRYHHLFQELLHDQLEKRMDREGIAALQNRASAWFAGNGLVDEAIKHALAGGEVDRAAELVEQNRMAVLDDDRWYVFDKWLPMFPDDIIQKQPGLLMARVWLHYHRFEVSEIPPILDAIESLLGDEPPGKALGAEINFMRGYILYFQNQGKLSLEYLQAALDSVPASHFEVRGQIEILWGLANQMQGRMDESLRSINDFIGEDPGQTVRMTRLLVTLVYIHIISGGLDEARAANQRLMDFTMMHNYYYAHAWSLYLMGLICFYRNDLDQAISWFRQASEQRFILHTRAVVDDLTGLTLSYQSRGESDLADAAARDLIEYASSLEDSAYSAIARSASARLAINRRDLKTAEDFLGQTPAPIENMVWWLEIPCVTYCRALIAEGSDSSLGEAEKRLQECLELNQANHNICHTIQIMVLLALAYDGLDRLDEALAVLKEAVALAEPGGWIRPFVEPGQPMIELLGIVIEQEGASDFVETLLAGLDKYRHPPEAGTFGEGKQSSRSAAAPSSEPRAYEQLDEPLTEREFEVLSLVAEGLRNKEIADRLFLSTDTVKKHLYNLYQKLDVHSRVQVVQKARDLGIMDK